MNDLQSYFRQGREDVDRHPLLRHLSNLKKQKEFREARLEVRRPRGMLGFEPAVMYLHFIKVNGSELPYLQEPWDEELNTALVKRGIQAIDEENEVIRFGLALVGAFQKPEVRVGEGFFSSVLVEEIHE